MDRAYDANGSTLTDPQGRSYTWDFENRPVQAVVPGTNGGTTNFNYDPFGRRIQSSDSLGTTNYFYDGPNIIEEVDSAGDVLVKFTQELRIDQPMAQLSGGGTGYYHQDGLGSVSSLTNATGVLTNSYAFDSFGRVTAHNGVLSNSFQYTGREFDSETGIYYYRARFYDPAAGRFLSEDPAEFLGGMNFYAYVDNRATSFVDPSGLVPQWWINLVNWWNPSPPQPLHFPPPPTPPIPLKCQFAAQCDFSPDMAAGLSCFRDCLGRQPTITCGRGGHAPNDPHSRGNGADFGTNHNPWMAPNVVEPCFRKCFPNSYCQQEFNNGNSGPTHWHFQFNPSRLGNIGCSPYIHPHGQ